MTEEKDDRNTLLKRALALIVYSDFIDLQMARELARRALDIDQVLESQESSNAFNKTITK